MKFVTYDQFFHDCRKLAKILPRDIRGVIGIPRSGMLAATLVAMERHVPLGEFSEFLKTGRFFPSGNRLNGTANFGPIAIIDDSCWSGNSLLPAQGIPGSIVAVVYGNPDLVDLPYNYCVRDITGPRRFEWNYLNRQDLSEAIVDIDGVLCDDPPALLEDDYPNYLHWMTHVEPKQPIGHKIGTLVTMRLEKSRPQTEAWLYANDIRYDRLLMHTAKTPQERRGQRYGVIKGQWAQEVGATWGIESEPSQAVDIAKTAGVPVICTGDKRVYE